MLKGVNKQIIEINDIENEHFYKAILFVRPESRPRSNEFLSKQANEYILSTSSEIKAAPSGFLRKKSTLKRRIIIICVSVALVALATVGLLLVL